VSSVAGFFPLPNMAVYSATKAYVTSLSEALSIELRPKGITVSVLCPGPVPTEFFDIATLIQTRKFTQTPMVCMGSEYWSGLFKWMKEVMLEEFGNISPGDLDMIKIFDTVDEVIAYFQDFYATNKLQPNF
jgi:short-subunit dehydrogenase